MAATSKRRVTVRAMHSRPKWQEIKSLKARPTWVSYFIYAPDGKLSTAHHFILSRLRDLGFAILVVCAAPEPGSVPHEHHSFCDALFWKGLGGYDFSAYALALWQVSRHSPGIDVFVLNDSVYGPFSDPRGAFRQAPWDLTGFRYSFHLCRLVTGKQSFSFRNCAWHALQPVI